jgi:hypothetical protein
MLFKKWLLGVSAAVLAGVTAGCQNMPQVPVGDRTVLGGSAMAAGAAIPADGALLSTLTKGSDASALVVGADWQKIRQHASREAIAAANKAKTYPATAADVSKSPTADLNQDGFITIDELLALQQAGLRDNDIVDRLEHTRAYFEVTKDQERYLQEHFIKPAIVTAMTGTDLQDEARTASAEIGPAVPNK